MNIVIIARERKDPVIRNIYYWIKALGSNPRVIYIDDLFKFCSFTMTIKNSSIDFMIDTREDVLTNKNVDLFFLRNEIYLSPSIMDDDEHKFNVVEFNATMELFCKHLKSINKIIGYCAHLSNNKLYQLDTASKCGIETPSTLITNSESSFKSFKTNKPLITKAVQGIYFKRKNNAYHTNYTSRISNEIEVNFSRFMLFQPEIEKSLELRVFVFLNTTHCVAAISNGFKNEIDIRVLMAEHQVEYYQYKLPKELITKLLILRKQLDIAYFSADVIVTPDEKYILIDVNPFGQISMLSQTKIFNLEKLIAKKIIQYVKKQRTFN